MQGLLLDGRSPAASDLDWLLASRALAFGEGIFTTLRVYQGQAIFLPLHLQRLQTGLQDLLCHTDSINWSELTTEIQQLSQNLGAGRLKIMLLAGSDTSGYRRSDKLVWHRLIQAQPLNYNADAYQGIHAWWQASPGDTPLAANKHLNRLNQVLASAGCPKHFVEAVHYNSQGFITEGLARNIFWYAQGQWHTSALSTGALAGVMRRQLLTSLDSVAESSVKLDQLQAAEEVFLCNSLMGIWPLLSLENDKGILATWKLGPLTQQLMATWHPQLGLPY